MDKELVTCPVRMLSLTGDGTMYAPGKGVVVLYEKPNGRPSVINIEEKDNAWEKVAFTNDDQHSIVFSQKVGRFSNEWKLHELRLSRKQLEG